jgi:hypothetical protein
MDPSGNVNYAAMSAQERMQAARWLGASGIGVNELQNRSAALNAIGPADFFGGVGDGAADLATHPWQIATAPAMFLYNAVVNPDETQEQMDLFARQLLTRPSRTAGGITGQGLVAAPLTYAGLGFLRSLRGPALAPSGPLTAAESWGNPSSLARHFRDHGADFGATSAEAYAQQASQFLQQSQARGLPTKIGPDGVIRVYDPTTNTFGAYNPNGTTRTFYGPQPQSSANPRGHSYPTNLDYWNAQPGGEPWTP